MVRTISVDIQNLVCASISPSEPMFKSVHQMSLQYSRVHIMPTADGCVYE